MTTYACAKCHAPAALVNGQVQRSCNCGATVVANVQAHAVGQGGVKQ